MRYTPTRPISPTGPTETGGRGVTGNESALGPPDGPDGWTADLLRDAVLMRLGVFPASAAACALVDNLAGLCAAREAPSRGNARRSTGNTKLRDAAGAIVGNVVTEWLHDPPRAVFQSRADAAFSGQVIGSRQYGAVRSGLLALGMIETTPGVSYEALGGTEFAHWQRLAERLRPSPRLLGIAASLGVTGEAVRADWGERFPPVPLRVASRDLVEVRAVRSFGSASKATRSPAVESLRTFGPIRELVETMNARAARHAFEGCLPPSWRRIFTGSPQGGGRWTAVGTSYQMMSQARRLAIRIDGAAVAELDIKASQLTILAALRGHGPLPADPYDIPWRPGLPEHVTERRRVAKQWVLATLGNGQRPRSWSTRVAPSVSQWDILAVEGACLVMMPFLADPSVSESGRALSPDGLPAKVTANRWLIHRLQNIEAQAMTLAMRRLWGRRIVALPVHDSLIVPERHCEVAAAAIRQACVETYGRAPVVERKR